MATGKIDSPILSYRLEIEDCDLRKLKNILKIFAKELDFEFHDVGIKLPRSEIIRPVIGRKPFFIDLRKGDIQIVAQDFSKKNAIELRFYGEKKRKYGEFIQLYLRLEENWPGKIIEIQ